MISINDLTISIDNKSILTNINLQWGENTIIGIVGLNGAGKTSIFKSILQLGFFKNKNISYSEGLKIKRDIGYLNESRGLFIKETVDHNLSYFSTLNHLNRDEAVATIDYWLTFFGILDLKNKKIFDLSKGNQQKIQFIASILGHKKYIILDEPFSGVDPVNADIFLKAIKQLHDTGASILYSSHQMEYVEELANRVIMIKSGKIIHNSSLDKLKSHYVVYTGNISNLKDSFIKQNIKIIADKEHIICDAKHSVNQADIARSTPTLSQIFKLVNGDTQNA
ncbi:ATP-binding cassette domain-containing protein [Holzapfeliella sp. He02]|uniref:ATP-binding cassette domain-containing protein n=1 Tax=Holzapfeliella saturejae TaxID=3082953 RepID=A0ABU8SGA0_9LACO